MEKQAQYETIAGALKSAIEKGKLVQGTKLPSVRVLAKEQGVSPLTALNALRALENAGVIEAKPRSGFFVRKGVREKSPSLTMESSFLDTDHDSVRQRHLAMHAKNKAIGLDLANAHTELYPVKRLSQIMRQLIYKTPDLLGAHVNGQGYAPLIEQIVRRAIGYGCTFSQDEVVITNGGLESLSLALKGCTKPGDCVVVEIPTYFLLLQMLKDMKLNVIEVEPLANGSPDFPALEALFVSQKIQAMVYTANFNNPNGKLISEEEKRKLTSLVDKYDVTLIEDDVYGEVYFGEVRPKPLRAYSDSVIMCNSFTKNLSPGLRVGWIACAGRQNTINQQKRISSKVTAEFTQAAITEFLKNGGYDIHMRRLRSRVKAYCQDMRQYLLARLPEGSTVSFPTGGYVLWITLPDTCVPAKELYERAYKKGIGMVPGYLFAMHDHQFERSFRLNFGYGVDDKVKERLEVLMALIHA